MNACTKREEGRKNGRETKAGHGEENLLTLTRRERRTTIGGNRARQESQDLLFDNARFDGNT